MLTELFRGIIGDDISPYTLPDSRIYKYLDMAIDELSHLVSYWVITDITVTETDITNGYITLPEDVVSIEYFTQNGYWQQVSANKISLIKYCTAGTYQIKYRRMYKKYKGEDRDASYFDYPEEAEMALLFYALAEYQQENGIINTDGSTDFVRSKSEEGLSITYGTLGAGDVMTMIGHPEALKKQAIDMMRNLPHSSNLFISVAI